MLRDPSEILARCRILSLLSALEDGFSPEVLTRELTRLALEGFVTAEEAALFRGEAERGADDGWQDEAMLALAWSIGLVEELSARDPEAYGPVMNQLVVEDDAVPRPRHVGEVVDMLGRIERYIAEGEQPPPNERFGERCLRWRRAGLVWALDVTKPWPP